MGSRVVAETQDLRWLAEGGVHVHTGSGEGGLRMVGAPHCMVGGCVLTRGGGAEGDQ